MQFNTQLISLAVAIFGACAGAAYAQEVIRIGEVGLVTGPIAHLDNDLQNGARTAIDELNAKGTVIGGKKVKFGLRSEDDGGDPTQGTAAAQKLFDEKVNAVICHLNVGTIIPASKLYFEVGTPQISPTSTISKYTQQGFNTTFRVLANVGDVESYLGPLSTYLGISFTASS